MKTKRTEFFELCDDNDLQTMESYNHSIVYCRTCKHFFFTKACGGRNIFESDTVYHPTDGNAVIAEIEYENDEERYSYIDCNHAFELIKTAKRLQELIPC